MTAWFRKNDDGVDAYTDAPDAKSMGADIARRHRIVAGVAAAVSVLLHVLLFLNLPGFNLMQVVKRDQGRNYAKLRLSEVRTETVRRVPAAIPDRGAPGSPDRRVAPARDVLTFKQPVDDSLVQPKPVPQATIMGDTRSVARPEVKPSTKTWDPRPEILEIQRPVVADTVAAMPRRIHELVERTPTTVDVLPPVDSTLPSGPPSPRAPGLFENLRGEIALVGDVGPGGVPFAGGVPGPMPRDALDAVPPPTRALAAVMGPTEPAIRSRHIENMLKVQLSTSENSADPGYLYCRIAIERAGQEVLPVLPKDIVFVQDCSASISEQKLYFCRQGLIKGLELIGPQDRFNVMGFRDSLQLAFPTWTNRTPETIKEGESFIRSMKSTGDTDFFASIQYLLSMQRDPSRPIIAVLVSDGAPTKGLTDSTTIIEAFSRANAGTISIFTLGTYAGVNGYLLDLISYRNRGDTHVVTSGRWDIPRVIEDRVTEVSRPVLTGLQFVFASGADCQAYPLLTSNLYLDRPLVVLARVSKKEKSLLFQAVGRAGDADCDMIFNLDLTKSYPAETDIPTSWAWQRIYHLIGVYTRTRSPAVLEDIRRTARQYKLKVPYQDWLNL